MSNNKPLKKLNQVSVDNKFYPIPDIVTNPLAIKQYVSHAGLRVYNYLIHLNNKYTHLHPTQSHIATALGYSRETVNRALRELRAYDLLRTWNRFKQSCLYYLPCWIKQPDVRQKLTALLPALWVGLSLLLLASVKTHPIEHVTLNKKDIYITNTFTKKIDQNDSVNMQNPVYGFDIVPIQTYEPWYDDESLALPRDIQARFVQQEYEKEIEHEQKQEKGLVAQLILGGAMSTSNEVGELFLRGFHCFKLTRAGIAQLMRFPVEALEFAESSIDNASKNKSPHDTFKAFYKLCETYCQLNDVQPNADLSRRLQEMQHLTNNMPMVDENFVPRKRTEPITIPNTPVIERKTYSNNNYYDKKSRYQNNNLRSSQSEYKHVKSPREWQPDGPAFVEEDPYPAAIKLAKNRLRPEIIAWEERCGFSGNPWLRKCTVEQQREIIALYPKEAQEFAPRSTTNMLSGIAEQIVSREPNRSFEEILDVVKSAAQKNELHPFIEHGNVATNKNKQEKDDLYVNQRSIEEDYTDFIPPFLDDDNGTEFLFL